MEIYDLVLIGATFFSFGASKASKGKTLVIDSKAKPGYEFIDAFHNGNNYRRINLRTQKGQEFADYFKRCGLLDKVYVPEWTPYLSRWICENEINVLFFTNVLSIEKEDEYYKITLYNTNGRTQILAKKIIDTRTKAFTKKQLNGLVYGGRVKSFAGSMKVTEFEKISLVEFDVPNGYSYPQARAHIFELWQNRPAEYEQVKIVAVADEFFKKPETECREVTEGLRHFYSAFYDNPLIAFDRGCRIGGESCD